MEALWPSQETPLEYVADPCRICCLNVAQLAIGFFTVTIIDLHS
jgi:hypothetical protein